MIDNYGLETEKTAARMAQINDMDAPLNLANLQPIALDWDADMWEKYYVPSAENVGKRSLMIPNSTFRS